jgi:hypothetical protein
MVEYAWPGFENLLKRCSLVRCQSYQLDLKVVSSASVFCQRLEKEPGILK